jgi:phospholipid/cholesterol/gamma-HCH transport system substrate-binding protein
VRDNLNGAVWRLLVFFVVCVTGTFALVAIFAQLRFQGEKSYNAHFTDVSGLHNGDLVRIAGVEVGKVRGISIRPDDTVLVGFNADDSVVLTKGSRAVIRYDNLIGGRYLALEEGTGSTAVLAPGQTIPVLQTSPALDLDALIGGFRPLFRALDPDQVNALSGQLIAAFQGQGGTISSFFQNASALTNTLADRDQLVEQVIGNLNVVLGSLGDQNTQFAKAIDSLSQLIGTLAGHKQEIASYVGYLNAAAGSLADLLAAARPPLQQTVHELDRSAGIIEADHDYVDNLLDTLPDAYKVLGRQGLYGDYFSFYLCNLIIKLNGKGGQPVYVKLAGQSTGRCTPR